MVAVQSEPEAARDGASRDNGVSRGIFPTYGNLETRGFCGASSQAGSPPFGWKRSPWQAESLAAVVLNLHRFNKRRGMRQNVPHPSVLSLPLAYALGRSTIQPKSGMGKPVGPLRELPFLIHHLVLRWLVATDPQLQPSCRHHK